MSEGDARRLWDRVRAAVARVDPAPPVCLEAGRAAYGWRTLDAELAALVGDSTEATALAGVRGRGPQVLTFAAPTGVVVEVQVEPAGTGRDLLGQVIGPVPGDEVGSLAVETGAGSVPVDVDGLGTFRCPGLPAGPLRLRLDRRGGRPVVTAWAVV